jgi:membrane protease YdiL (CAAX protease family)
MDWYEWIVKEKRLRPGFRVIFFLVITVPILYGITLLLWEELLIRYFISFWLLLGLSFLAIRYWDKRPFGTLGFMFHSRWIKEFVQGLAIGFGMVTVLFFLEMITGAIRISWNPITFSLLLQISIVSGLKTLFQSSFEELYFRGYLYQNLISATNPIIATLGLSVLFGIGHMLTPHARWIVALNLTVFGVIHAVGYLKTKSLFLSSGLHFSWNFFMRHVYSLPVSGRISEDSLLTVTDRGPGWLTGGEYGPEAGLPALLLLIAGSFLIWFWGRIRVAPETENLLEN